MRSHITSGFSIFILSVLMIGCCTTTIYRYNTKKYTPVYKSTEELKNSVTNESPRLLKNPGKIYIFGKYLFIVEKGTGVHIIDDSNPASPQFLSFITIPGAGDIAVKNSILYADSYYDLVAIDISDPVNARVVKRIESIFPNPLDPDNIYKKEKKVLVEWLESDTVVSYSYSDCGGSYSTSPDVGYYEGDVRADNLSDGQKSSNSSGGGPTGKGGSMARMTLYQNYLYAVDHRDLQTFDISDAANPKPWNKLNIGWNIETIFPYKDKLFIGSQTGMFIYDNSTPWTPTFLAQFSHARGCDPVVANDKYAYVTLRTGTRCSGGTNTLDILDITEITNPKLLKTYQMQQPGGLGVYENTLFLCDGPAGLKVFDVKDPYNIQLISWESEVKNYDVIPLGTVLLMIGDDGLYQYDYTDPRAIKLLSVIPVNR